MEEPDRADDVDGGVELRGVHRAPDVDLRGVMAHGLGAEFFEDARKPVVEQAHAEELRARVDVLRLAVERSSRIATSWPSSMNRSATWLPMKAAPPVTRIRIVCPHINPKDPTDRSDLTDLLGQAGFFSSACLSPPCSARIRAKTMRPALVWSVLVTTTVTESPMCARPPSTTTIVPSCK